MPARGLVMWFRLENHIVVIALAIALVSVLMLYYISRWKQRSARLRGLQIKSFEKSAGQNGIAIETAKGGTYVVIVGAGVAGSALACTLGKDGRHIHVIERDLSEPDRIVGELLQPGGYLKLIELGLQDCVEEIDAQRIMGYALFKEGKDTKVAYPLENYHADVAGRSFHNGRFIQRIREKAASLPNVHMEQGTVLYLIEKDGVVKGVKYKSTAGEELEAFSPLTVVCDGCFSNLRRSHCNPKVDVPSCFVGLVLEDCILPHPKTRPSCREYLTIYGVITGTQPPGDMSIRYIPVRSRHGWDGFQGYPGIDIIEITYAFPNGIQTAEHPSPGRRYTDTRRVACLPKNKEGEDVLELLKIAWNHCLIFTVGTSVTTGRSATAVWAGIHHKTQTYGGFSNYGYLDETYFDRVKKELALVNDI